MRELKRKSDIKSLRCRNFTTATDSVDLRVFTSDYVKKFGGDPSRVRRNITHYRAKTDAHIPSLEFCLRSEDLLNLPRGTIYREVSRTEAKLIPELSRKHGEIPLRFSARNPSSEMNGAPPSDSLNAGFDAWARERGFSSRQLAEVIFNHEHAGASPDETKIKALDYKIRLRRRPNSRQQMEPELVERIAAATKEPKEAIVGAQANPHVIAKKFESPGQGRILISAGQKEFFRTIRYDSDRKQLVDEQGSTIAGKDKEGRYLRIPVTDVQLLMLITALTGGQLLDSLLA